MERFQELAEGPRENTQKCGRTQKSVSMIYIQHSKKGNMRLKPGFKTRSDSTAVIWNDLDTAQFIAGTHWFGCFGSF